MRLEFKETFAAPADAITARIVRHFLWQPAGPGRWTGISHPLIDPKTNEALGTVVAITASIRAQSSTQTEVTFCLYGEMEELWKPQSSDGTGSWVQFVHDRLQEAAVIEREFSSPPWHDLN